MISTLLHKYILNNILTTVLRTVVYAVYNIYIYSQNKNLGAAIFNEIKPKK